MGGVVRTVTNTLGITEDDSLDAANAATAAGMNYMKSLEVPELTFKNYIAENFNPEMMDATLIEEDPSLRASQMAALERLGGLAETGLSELDELGFQNAINMAGQISRGGREAALQDAASRGLAGSGLEFAMRELANQEAAQRAQQAALQQAATAAQQRAQYQMAYQNALGNQRQQDFGVNQANTNIINQFNQANTQARNEAQLGNIDRRAQAFQYNQEGRNQTKQQNFQNEFNKRQAVMGGYNQQAQNAMAQGAANAQREGALLGAAATLGGAAMMSDKNAKKNVESGDSSIEALLESLSAKNFEYKGDDVEHTGIMAQDLEKTKVGAPAVIDTPSGKMVHGAKAATLSLAALANIHDRLKKLEGEV